MWKFKRISDMVEFFKKIICNDITIGNGEKNVIEFDKTKDSASRPKIRYSNETSRFQYTMNGVDWFNFGTSSSGDANTIEQVDVVAPESTQSTSPHIVDIPITYNVDFKRRDPSVLKFIAGVNNVTRSGCLFDLSDSTKFNLNEDGTGSIDIIAG